MSLVNFNEEFKDKGVKFVARTLIFTLSLVVIVFFIIVLIKVMNKEHVSALGVELNIPATQDTLYKTETIIYKLDTVIKYKETIRQIPSSSGFSKVIDAKNVNTGNNDGIIGDYGTIHRAEQRHLNDSLKQRLITRMDKFFDDNKLSRSVPIRISFNAGDKESDIFTREIQRFLQSRSYWVEGINLIAGGNIEPGLAIQPVMHNGEKSVLILVGYAGFGSGIL
jgi:hypothetical protein